MNATLCKFRKFDPSLNEGFEIKLIRSRGVLTTRRYQIRFLKILTLHKKSKTPKSPKTYTLIHLAHSKKSEPIIDFQCHLDLLWSLLDVSFEQQPGWQFIVRYTLACLSYSHWCLLELPVQLCLCMEECSHSNDKWFTPVPKKKNMTPHRHFPASEYGEHIFPLARSSRRASIPILRRRML